MQKMQKNVNEAKKAFHLMSKLQWNFAEYFQKNENSCIKSAKNRKTGKFE